MLSPFPFRFSKTFFRQHGIKNVHKWVGREPSGGAFNAFSLNRENKPHNPMINAGAFITHWLVKQDQRASQRISSILHSFKRVKKTLLFLLP